MILNSEINEFDVIIVGGGATGAGTARDCALRGMRVLLVERFDFAAGATGRNHGLQSRQRDHKRQFAGRLHHCRRGKAAAQKQQALSRRPHSGGCER